MVTNHAAVARKIVTTWLREPHLDKYFVEPPERDRLIGEITTALTTAYQKGFAARGCHDEGFDKRCGCYQAGVLRAMNGCAACQAVGARHTCWQYEAGRSAALEQLAQDLKTLGYDWEPSRGRTLSTLFEQAREAGRREERRWREMLWYRHGCESPSLYGDDGEMQCSACLIDFKRESAEAIHERFLRIGEAKLRATGRGAEADALAALRAREDG